MTLNVITEKEWWLWTPNWRWGSEHQIEEDEGSEFQIENMALNAELRRMKPLNAKLKILKALNARNVEPRTDDETKQRN